MYYTKENAQSISFPLGGIGSGCIGLAGNGTLCDWEIFNSPNKNSILGYSHFCLRAGKDFRILQGDCFAPYSGKYRKGDDNKHRGFGWGVEEYLLPGLPHFGNTLFNGRFPVAEITFSEAGDFPLSAFLTAWSPFIPGMERESSLPCAVFEYTIQNHSQTPVETTLTGVLANPFLNEGHLNFLRSSGRTMTLSDGGKNELSLTLMADRDEISFQEYLYRGGWVDSLEMYLTDLGKGGRFQRRTYQEHKAVAKWDHALLAQHFTLAPSETRVVTFVISWHVPECSNTWDANAGERAQLHGLANSWLNYYATQWANSEASALELQTRFDELRKKTFCFTDMLHASALDPAIIDGASACLSTLRSPTCLRLEDGTLYGWEGVGTSWGSCPGSCIHVWNYAQAAAFLFPTLERSMQESHLNNSVHDTGGVQFRLQLPLGIKPQKEWFRPCADGQFGLIMKIFRDWKISGDTNWLKKHYALLKKIMEFTWRRDNPDLWDPEETGVLTGRQHHTLDMELFGANSWLTGFYLGALKAMVSMAAVCGDDVFSQKCAQLLQKGQQEVKKCFNGTHFCQPIDLKKVSLLDNWEEIKAVYWNEECGELKYQIGEGVAIDACLGEFFASFYGIGHVFDEKMTRQTLRKIFSDNFRSMKEHINPWRSFAVNDEKGVCICTWPQNKPAIPLPYNSEMMNGFEWAFASHLLLCGMNEEALQVIRAVRQRYDGVKRNPWNEFECGSNYARSMAAFALIPIASGFTFDMTEQMLGFSPRLEGLTNCFWSTGKAWGQFTFDGTGAFLLETACGKLPLKKLLLPLKAQQVTLNGQTLPFQLSEGSHTILLDAVMTESSCLRVEGSPKGA